MATSILEHIRSHLDPDGIGVSTDGERLPDEDPDPQALHWAPGAMDGVFGHHVAEGDPEGEVSAVVDLLEAASAARWRAGAARQKLYDGLRELSVVSIVDDVLNRLDDPRRHHDVARWLVHEGAHREPVKFGIALLGRAATAEDLNDLRVLGKHEEFTLFSAVALANWSDDPEFELWQLARAVDGWGRIQIIDRLAGTERPEIKDWLLRGGFRNSVMNEYTAYTAATTGGLVAALEGPADPELLSGAVDIMRALIAGGPAEDIGHYAEGPSALRLVLDLIERGNGTPSEGMLVLEAARLFSGDDRVEHWTVPVQEELAAQCARIMADPKWPVVVERGLLADETFWEAEQLAQVLGIDTFPALVGRLRADPFSHYWYQAMQRVDADRLPQLLTVADDAFHAVELGSGPADEFGFGPMFAKHSALEQLVTGLGRFPGEGWPHVRTAMRSPVVRSRNMALNTLAAWGPDAWPEEVHSVLAKALSAEPRDDVRRRIQRLLAGQPLDD